jgi:hypothetical protein
MAESAAKKALSHAADEAAVELPATRDILGQ